MLAVIATAKDTSTAGLLIPSRGMFTLVLCQSYWSRSGMSARHAWLFRTATLHVRNGLKDHFVTTCMFWILAGISASTDNCRNQLNVFVEIDLVGGVLCRCDMYIEQET